MNQAEAVALRWVSRHLHILECRWCGGAWITAKTTTTIFHRCHRPPPSPLWSPPTDEEDRQTWARRLLGAPDTEEE